MVGYIAKFVSYFIGYCDGHGKTNPKTFNDPIHGTIQLGPVLQKIINTPEFQRLRHIKQLGGTFYVYPVAEHSRFGHSIGTAHLAGKLVKHLKERQPELGISDKDVLCVEIAGLCHDLGHGPFSHFFDQTFLKHFGIEWKHEEVSCIMLDKIMKRLKDDKDIKRLDRSDLTFIKEMINLPKNSKFCGRGQDKAFLYEIISNKECGVDVDKWDYFARDCHHLGIANGFDHNRFIKFTRVIEVEEEDGRPRQHICVRDKEAFNLYQMFHTRYSLHRRAYQHRKKNAVELMICDALIAANDHVDIPGKDGEKGCKMSECIKPENIESFCNLDDRVLQKIEHHPSCDPDMKKAKQILRRIHEGKHYELVGSKILDGNNQFFSKEKVKDLLLAKNSSLRDEIEVSVIGINYGRGDEDPVRKMWFYKQDDRDTAIRIKKSKVSKILPDVFQEKLLQVFCRNTDLVENARKAFREVLDAPK